MIDYKNIIKNLPENDAQEYADLELDDALRQVSDNKPSLMALCKYFD